MKTKLMFLATLIAALTLGFSACEDKNDGMPDKSDLVGTWDPSLLYGRLTVDGVFEGEEAERPVTEDDEAPVITVNADGTGEFYFDEDETDEIEWTLSGKELTVTYVDDPDNEVEKFYVEKLTDSQLVISFTGSKEVDGGDGTPVVSETYTRFTFVKR